MRHAVLSLLSLGLVLGSGSHRAAGHDLTLEVATARGLVWHTAVRPGERIDLSFLHSSERCLWTQHYRVTPSGLWQQASTFPCVGAGMWSASSPAASAVHTARGYLVPAPRFIGALTMLSWRRGAIVLDLFDRSVRLSPMLEDFEAFTVRVR